MGRRYNRDDKFFSSWSQDMAYVLGYLTADGCITDVNRIVVRTQESDRCILEYIKVVMNLEHPIILVNDNNSKMYDISVRSDKMASDLMLLNVTPKKSLTIIAPPLMPDNMFSHYLRGLFDGDGCIYIRNRGGNYKQISAEAYIDTASEVYAGQINMMLNHNSINSNIHYKHDCRLSRAPMYRVYTTGKSVVDFAEFIYHDANFKLERKYNKFQEYFTGRFTNCNVCGKSFFRKSIQSTTCDDCRHPETSEAICSAHQ